MKDILGCNVFGGYKIVESSRLCLAPVQRRRHRKKLINKKWRKRYGMVRPPDPKLYISNLDHTIYGHPTVIRKLKAAIEKEAIRHVLENKEELL